jgi:hypothetical protein
MGQRTVRHAVALIGLEATCTLPRQGQVPKCFGGGSRTSKDRYGPADVSALLPNAGWLSSHVRPHQREVCSHFGRGDAAARLNPYPADYRPAFASSLLLYPLPYQVLLRLPLLSEGSRATGLPRSAGGTVRVV